MLKTKSAGVKRQHEPPGVDANQRYLDWVASLGDETGRAGVNQFQSHRRVTFDEDGEVLKDVKDTPQPALIPTEETVSSEWGVDGDDPPHSSTEHRERITWRLAPSKRHISYKEGRHQESYDMDLLVFQAGSYASDEEETSYLEADINGRLVKGVQIETPEDDYIPGITDDMPVQAHSTQVVDAGDLAYEPNAISK